MDIIEQVARMICAAGGADPDAPLTIGRYRQVEVEGSLIDELEPVTSERILETTSVAAGWLGYADLAGAIVATVEAGKEAAL